MLSPGDRVKDYEVIAPLRSGGMAMLYLARRRGVGGFSRLVALKLVHSHLLEHEGINRLFLEEARIAANIAHPNVVNVEEVGRCGGSYFIAMEYVHGVSLGELLGSLVDRRLRMSPKLCVWLAAQVAEALHAAHEATGENGVPLHVVHRDVSPQNILISHTGHIKLIDFGIADSQHTSEHAGTAAGSVLGKLGYMAPEQLRLQVADRRSDVYALGVTLWEMLTSRNLFRCQRIDDERDWATREAPPPPSNYSAIAMPALDRVVLKAIACDPKARFESALAFRSALLRAAPAAAQVDAPMFAALMHTMLGAELERRRANWPSDVSRELHLDEIENTPALNLGELTADMGGDDARAPFDVGEDEDPTTIAEAPSALRSARPAAPGVEHAAAYGAATPSTPEARIDTVAVPPSTARPPANRTARALSLAGLSLVLGMVLGSLATGSPPSGALGAVLETPARAAPATAPRRSKSTFTVLSELTVKSAPSAELPAPAATVALQAPPARAADPSAGDAPAPLLPDSSQALTSTAEAQPGADHALARATGRREPAPSAQRAAAVERRAPAHARVSKRGPAGLRKGAPLRPARAKLGAGNRKNKNAPRPRALVADPNAPW
jgi:serine/threonine protein kinase